MISAIGSDVATWHPPPPSYEMRGRTTGAARPGQETFPHHGRNQRYGRLTPYPANTGDLCVDNGRVALQRMDNIGIVVESLDAAVSFFAELGLELEGRAMIEGDWSGRVTGLRDQRV